MEVNFQFSQLNLFVIVFILCYGYVLSYPKDMGCSTYSMAVGTKMSPDMCSKNCLTFADGSRTMTVKNSAGAVYTNGGQFIPGETLSITLSSVSGYYLFGTSAGAFQAVKGMTFVVGCTNRIWANQKAYTALLTAPQSGSVTIEVNWATNAVDVSVGASVTLTAQAAASTLAPVSVAPIISPTAAPTLPPSLAPVTAKPTLRPTSFPSYSGPQSVAPTSPTRTPTTSRPIVPSAKPTSAPTLVPTLAPSSLPTTSKPTLSPTTYTPTLRPTTYRPSPATDAPSIAPLKPSAAPVVSTAPVQGGLSANSSPAVEFSTQAQLIGMLVGLIGGGIFLIAGAVYLSYLAENKVKNQAAIKTSTGLNAPKDAIILN